MEAYKRDGDENEEMRLIMDEWRGGGRCRWDVRVDGVMKCQCYVVAQVLKNIE